MGVKKDVDYASDEVLKEIYNCAMEVFGQGIAVPSDMHPCGWDWINFKNIDDILEDKFYNCDISDGAYGRCEYCGLTLKEILIKTCGKFLFEINCAVDWDK